MALERTKACALVGFASLALSCGSTPRGEASDSVPPAVLESSSATAPEAATARARAPSTVEPQRVRLCVDASSHGYHSLVVKLEPGRGGRRVHFVRCESVPNAVAPTGSPTSGKSGVAASKQGVTEIDVHLELPAPWSVRSEVPLDFCHLPYDSHRAEGSLYPAGKSRLARNARVVVRVNGVEAGALVTDERGNPAIGSCITVPVASIPSAPP